MQIDLGIRLGDVDRFGEDLEIVGQLVADLSVELAVGLLVDAERPRDRTVGKAEIAQILFRTPAVGGARGEPLVSRL